MLTVIRQQTLSLDALTSVIIFKVRGDCCGLSCMPVTWCACCRRQSAAHVYFFQRAPDLSRRIIRRLTQGAGRVLTFVFASTVNARKAAVVTAEVIDGEVAAGVYSAMIEYGVR